MPISFESVREFARAHGDVKIAAPQTEVRILKNGEIDVFDLIEKATDFWFGGGHYARQEFEKILSESSNQKQG